MAKRDNGTGTIYQRSNDSWVGKIYLGRDENGKPANKKSSPKMDLTGNYLHGGKGR